MRYYTTEEIESIIENEGFEYGICDYMDLNRIEDDIFRTRCVEFKKLRDLISDYYFEYIYGKGKE